MADDVEQFDVDDDLRAIAQEIVARDLPEPEWAARESDDEFQRGTYAGGYDADERAFVFEVILEGRGERWFQIDLDEVAAVADGRIVVLPARVPS